MRFLFLSLILGLSLGFILANTFYRLDESQRSLRHSQPTQAQANSQTPIIKSNNPNESPAAVDSEENSLSVEELRQAIDKADQNENNLQLQRDLGIAVFKYSALERRVDFIPDAIRLLERAAQKPAAFSAHDKELFETLGNALFVQARRIEPGKMPLARRAYQRELQIEPNNPDILVNIGLTYFFEQPSNPTTAIDQYNRALNLEPRHEKALENLIVALLALKQNDKADQSLQRLRLLNPNNESLNDLQAQVNQALLIKN